MTAILRFEATGYRDTQGRFAKRTPELRQYMRDGIRDLGRAMVANLKHYAPEDKGIFKAGIGFQTRWKGDVVQTVFFVGGKHAFLLPIITGGSKAHRIPIGGAAEMMAKGYPLRWVDKMTGEVRYAWEVWHPGTMPDPFVERAVDASSPQIMKTMSKIARRVAWVS